MDKQKPEQKKDFEHSIGRKAVRKLRAQQEKDRPVWFGLGMLVW